MTIEELAKFFEFHGVGGYEVHYLLGGGYVAIPLRHNERLITAEAHEENMVFFRNHPD